MVQFANYKDVSNELKLYIYKAFEKEWGAKNMQEYITNKWIDGHRDNILIVLFDNIGVFLGTVGLTHRCYCIPVVSHLYIEPSHRNKGYCTILMAEISKRTNTQMYYWCAPEKTDHYEAMGWKKNVCVGLAPVCVGLMSICITGSRMVSMTRRGTKYG
jgi:hypothetical protein